MKRLALLSMALLMLFTSASATVKSLNTWVDSMQIDSLRHAIIHKYDTDLPTNKVNRKVDRFSPFKNPLFAQRRLSKFWFFAMFLIAAAALILFLQNFGSQFSVRIQSLYNKQKLKELNSEKQRRLSNANFFLLILNTFVHCLFFNLILIRFKYFELNNVFFFLLLFLLYLLLQLLVFGIKFLHSATLQIKDDLHNFTIIQINLDFVFTLFYLPLALVLYLNPNLLFSIHPLFISSLALLPFLFRIVIQLFTIFQEGYSRLSVLLYFCTFEILPVVIFVYTLVNILNANG